MKRIALAFGLLAASAAVAQDGPPPGGQERGGRGFQGRPYANPSAVIAAELALSRLAAEKGEFTAYLATAASGAVVFAPRIVYAQSWLKGRANPAVAAKRQVHQVSMSCDGSLGVSQGAWQGEGKQTGYFTTLWQRQKNGGYKWLLDSGDALKEPLPAPEMIAGKIADCPARGRRPSGGPGAKAERAKPPAALDPAHRSGKSDDGTMSWEVTVDRSGARNLSVEWKKDGALAPLLIEEVAAPGSK